MSYFDHVRCSRCGAMLDPESLGGGRGFNCPKCGEELAVQDLFGVAAAFSEEEEGPLSLEDAIPGWSAEAASSSRSSRPSSPSAGASGSAPARRGPLPDNRSLPVRDSQPRSRRQGGQQGAPSALDLMRQMKKGKK